MNIRDLQYLVAVAKLGHFGRAAAACFVSQPTLSMQLKKLEGELGVTLFERNNKQVLITDIGKAIVNQAKTVLHEVGQLKEMATLAHDPLAGELRLGVIPTIAPYLLPHVITPIRNQCPKLSFYFVEEKTHVLFQQLSDGDIDAAILALPIEEGFDSKLLFVEPFYLACAKSHKLASQSSINMDDLQDEMIMLLGEGHCLRTQALELCNKLKSNNLTDFSATSLETLRLMVASGNGVTLLPALAVLDNKLDTLATVSFSQPSPARDLALVWRSSSYKQQLFEVIASTITTTVEPKISSLK